jgi:type VI secretion system Hcp family effector
MAFFRLRVGPQPCWEGGSPANLQKNSRLSRARLQALPSDSYDGCRLNRCEEIAMPIYMRITKKGVPIIAGSAAAKGHEKWIELSSAQMGSSRSEAINREIVITKSMDSASMALFQQSLYGEGVTIQIDFVKSGRHKSTYLTFTLQDVLISSYQPGFSRSDGPTPTESVALNFTKITFDTHGASPDATGHAEVLMRGWNASPGAP